MKKKTLLLNADFLPYSVVSWKRAFVLGIINSEMPGEGAEPVEYYDEIVRSAGGVAYPVPAVARLAKYVRRAKISFSRRNVFIRDNLTCQYCGKKFEPDELTYDHVIPRSEWKKKGHKGTPTNWTNIVTACEPCNRYKGDSSLEKCGMRLIRKPEVPDNGKHVKGLVFWDKNIPEQWKLYLRCFYPEI